MDDFAAFALERLVRSSLQSIVLVGVVWAASRVLRAGPAMRTRLWWLVSAQMMLGLVVGPVDLPWLPATTDAAPMATTAILYAAGPYASHVVATATVAPAMTWQALVCGAWLLVVLLLLALDALGWRATRRLVAASDAIGDSGVVRLAARVAEELHLRQVPRLHASSHIDAPHVTGLWHPVILLPPPGALTDRELAMAIAHEMAHIRRGDLWLGLLPAFAKRLFFFHPAVFIAAREYALAREAACDRLVIDAGQVAPDHYGRLLLSLGTGRSLQATLGSASPTYKTLKRRLIMLQQPSEKPLQRALAWVVVAAVAVAGTLPYRVVAAPSPVEAGTPGVAAPAPMPAPEALPASPAAPALPARDASPTSPALPEPPLPPPPPPLPPAPPSMHLPPPPPVPPAPPVRSSQTSINIQGDETGLAFALHDQGMRIVNGDIDVPDGHAGAPAIWVRDGSHRYVIRDKATIDRVQGAFKAQLALSERQRALGEKQAALGGQQAALGREQAELGMRQANAAMAEAGQPSQVRQASHEARQAEIARLQRDIAARQRPIADQQRQLGEQQAELGRQQRTLSAGVREQTQRTIQEAIRNGVATPVTAN